MLHIHHHPAAFLCTTETALQVLLMQVHSEKKPKKSLKYQGLRVTKQEMETAKHRQVPESCTLKTKNLYFLAWQVSDAFTVRNGIKSSGNAL